MNIKFPYWDGLRKLLVDRGDGTHAERVEAYPPAKLMTDGDGDYARIRVDVGQTGFFAGREFSTFYDFTVPNNQKKVIRAIASCDVVLQQFGVELETAKLKVSIYAGGTATGSFDTSLPIIKVNQMSTASNYTSQVTMDDNATGHSGGQIATMFKVDASARGNVDAVQADIPYGFPAGTYYIVLENIGGTAANGVFRARWEERP